MILERREPDFMVMNEKVINDIETIASDLGSILEAMGEIPGMYDSTVDSSLDFCRSLPAAIGSNTLKIAVVGAIKSGKTTFVNAWLKDDLLKRGSGVVTAIVTRIQRAKALKARIFIKSWDDVNREIEQALFMFPEQGWQPERDLSGFDLRRERDRQFLSEFNQKIFSDISLSDSGLRPESVTITRAVEGFEAVKDIVKPDRSVFECSDFDFSGFESSNSQFSALESSDAGFETHKKFTGNDSTAFFVRDVELGVTSPGLDPNVEIADCQGSDSTNPSHMTQIQSYLTKANLIIYLISSRTGLRRADMDFLRVIKTMGLMENILFVLNVDLNEHDTLEDLITVEHRVKKELTYVKRDPELYAVSSLYSLLCELAPDISRKNRVLLDLWNEDKRLVDYLTSMTEKFNSRLNSRLDYDRFYLTVANPIERLGQIALMARQRISIFSDLLSQDLRKAKNAMDRLKEMLETGKSQEAIMDSSIEGAVDLLEQETHQGAVSLFDPRKGIIAKEVFQFLTQYSMDFSVYSAALLRHGFEHTLYLMFQELKSALDIFMAQTVNARVLGFVHDRERAFERYFKTLYRSYDINLLELFPGRHKNHDPSHKSDYDATQESGHGAEHISSQTSGHGPIPGAWDTKSPIDLRTIRGILGLNLPERVFSIRYSARIRAGAMAKYGIFSLGDLAGKLIKKREITPGMAALAAAEKKIRADALKSVARHLTEYQDAVTDDYLSPLLAAVSRDFKEKLVSRCRGCDVQIKTMEGVIDLNREEKKAQSRMLENMEAGVARVIKKTEDLPIYCSYL
jgi:GTPase SAR1 family protein